MSLARIALKRATSVVAVVSMVAVGLTVGIVTAPLAAADPAPLGQRTAAMATADVLPTVQIDGVVWAQAVVGNTVFAGGQFANARPAGAAAGTNLTPRANFLSYNLATGALNTTFAPSTNGPVQVVAVSPDKKTVYIGGTFTQANGQNRYRLAAYNVATGALSPTFKPILNNQVKTITATNTTVYVGGTFTTANGVARTRLAAFSAAQGSLLSWAPTADGVVNALVLTPDGSRVIAGGSFQNVNRSPAYGLAAIAASTGALLPWAASKTVRDAGANAGIFSLSTDGTSIFGTGWVFGGTGVVSLEGTFSADPNTGTIKWVEDCHGDTYGAYSDGTTVYTVSHAHYCSTVNGFPQSDPWSVNQRHALAFSARATGTLGHNIYGRYQDWAGTPSPTLYNWFPEVAFGNYTSQGQAAWNVTGSGDYVVMGGEFPSVSGVAQQGLVRFAKPNIAPKKERPRLSGPNFLPTLVALPDGRVRVSWQSNWDRDDLTLNYKVYRNNSATPIYTTTADATFWNRPNIGFIDSGLTPGATYQYKVSAFDADGNVGAGSNASIVAPAAGGQSPYAAKIAADGASPYWRMDEASGTTLIDSNGFADGTTGTGVTRGAAGAIIGDTDTATTFDGTVNGTANSPTAIQGPDTFSLEAWINTTSTNGGKIIGFGSNPTGNSGSYDRHVYMDNSGKIYFGVYTGNTNTVNSAKAFNDGKWHHIVASMGPAGMVLYIDDVLAGSRSDTTVGQNYTGYWRVGGDNIGGWPGAHNSNNFAGSIDDVAIYPTVLTRAQIDAHYVASGRTSTIPVAPADTYGAGVFNDNPSLYWRVGEATGTTAVDAGPSGENGIYSGGVTLGAAGAIAGSTNTAVQFDGNDGLLVSTDQVSNPTIYSEEMWFKTTTNQGGKLIGFGNAPTGTSSNYDRHVYMETDGRLTFGTWTGQTNLATSTQPYNDGAWHHMVATQSSDGMKLYVDGAVVGSNPQTSAQAYDGYWRVGGDVTWNGTDPYWQGTVDEVAIYPSALTAAQVAAHYAKGTANQNPVAAFTSSSTDLVAAFDGSASADPDGSVASYSWNFGDNTAAGTTVNPSHTYGAAGTYQVTLTVTDNKGGTNSVTHPVTVTPPNQNPVAAFTSSSTGLVAAFDGSASADPDGSVASYSWNFGDNTAAGTTVSPSHTYGAGGTYQVTLTVTDNKGGTNAVTHAVTVTPPNQPPVAAFSPTAAGLTATLDATGSSDPDGTISSYAWDFGDNTSGTGVSPSHAYTAGGTYQVTLTVTDNAGATASVTHPVTVVENQAPVAAFTATSAALTATFDGSGSADSDGSIASYSWDFGDNTAAGSGVGPTHTYTAAGTYQVTLTVKDNQNAVGTITNAVTVAKANQPPQAAFTSTTSALVASFDGTGSADQDGSIASYAWNFGDATAAGSGATPNHTYAAAGTYHVTLTVTDDKGATAAVTHDVMVAVPNQAPTASFTVTASGLVASLNASASTDADGTIAGYAWKFGDGQPDGSGVTTSHTYAAAGTYTVTLTVTDDQGATGTTTRSVVATAPQGAFASDLFGRTVSNGWGSADQGGAWAVSGTGGAANFSVVQGTGKLRMPSAGATDAATLSGVSQTGADVKVAFTSDLPSTGGGIYFSTTARRVGTTFYSAKALVGSTGKVTLYLAKTVSGTETVLKTAVATGITYTPGMVLRLRFQAIGSGTTTLNARIWQDGQTEPTSWLTSTTDTTAALQAPGAVGVIGYLSGTANNAPVTWLIKSFDASTPAP